MGFGYELRAREGHTAPGGLGWGLWDTTWSLFSWAELCSLVVIRLWVWVEGLCRCVDGWIFNTAAGSRVLFTASGSRKQGSSC